MGPPKRMTANPQAPLRYRPGKPVGDDSSSSESDSESDSAPPPPPPRAPSAAAPIAAIAVSKQDLGAARAQRTASQQALAAQADENEEDDGFVTASSEESSSGEEEEESSADEGPRFVAPTFVSKANRNKQPVEEDVDVDFQRRRRQVADEHLQNQIERDLEARKTREWDQDDEGVQDDVDDTDGLDPEAERAAWKLREFRRVKREREAIEAAEAEREEIERRRNLSTPEREAEDREFLDRQREERDTRPAAGFMQRYHHKGAFFQGEMDEELASRNLMGARFEDDVDRETLPQYMQIRDMSKLGKRSRTKYKDLRSEDTGIWNDTKRQRYG